MGKTGRPHIILVDSDISAGAARARALERHEACRVTAVTNAAAAGRAKKDGPADLVLFIRGPERLGDLILAVRKGLKGCGPERAGSILFGPGGGWVETAAGVRKGVTAREHALLYYLARAGGRAVSRDELLCEVLGYRPDVATKTLESHIYRLRRKIGPGIVLTVPGGYRFSQADEAE